MFVEDKFMVYCVLRVAYGEIRCALRYTILTCGKYQSDRWGMGR